MEQINTGIGPKNQRSKFRAKYSALSPTDQKSPPRITANTTLFGGMLGAWRADQAIGVDEVPGRPDEA
ncbi:hypothetical protein NL676_001115 [Syzygium grande]|nr:hypothetical protein NL676_001115 [Syzygium grande]